MKRGVLWVFTDSLLKIRNAVLNAGGRETLQVIPRTQIAFVGGWVHFTHTAGQVSETALLGTGDGKIDLAGEGLGNISLDLQNVAQVALISLSPKLRVVFKVNELSRDSHAVPCPPHTTFKNVINVQIALQLT